MQYDLAMGVMENNADKIAAGHHYVDDAFIELFVVPRARCQRSRRVLVAGRLGLVGMRQGGAQQGTGRGPSLPKLRATQPRHQQQLSHNVGQPTCSITLGLVVLPPALPRR